MELSGQYLGCLHWQSTLCTSLNKLAPERRREFAEPHDPLILQNCINQISPSSPGGQEE